MECGSKKVLFALGVLGVFWVGWSLPPGFHWPSLGQEIPEVHPLVRAPEGICMKPIKVSGRYQIFAVVLLCTAQDITEHIRLRKQWLHLSLCCVFKKTKNKGESSTIPCETLLCFRINFKNPTKSAKLNGNFLLASENVEAAAKMKSHHEPTMFVLSSRGEKTGKARWVLELCTAAGGEAKPSEELAGERKQQQGHKRGSNWESTGRALHPPAMPGFLSSQEIPVRGSAGRERASPGASAEPDGAGQGRAVAVPQLSSQVSKAVCPKSCCCKWEALFYPREIPSVIKWSVNK